MRRSPPHLERGVVNDFERWGGGASRGGGVGRVIKAPRGGRGRAWSSESTQNDSDSGAGGPSAVVVARGSETCKREARQSGTRGHRSVRTAGWGGGIRTARRPVSGGRRGVRRRSGRGP